VDIFCGDLNKAEKLYVLLEVLSLDLASDAVLRRTPFRVEHCVAFVLQACLGIIGSACEIGEYVSFIKENLLYLYTAFRVTNVDLFCYGWCMDDA